MSDEPQPHQPTTPTTGGDDGRRVVVVTEAGMGVAHEPEKGGRSPGPADQVEQPAKVMRLGAMVKQLLEEVRSAPLDEASRARLAEIHRRSVTELKESLSDDLAEELDRITLPFGEQAPSEPELRIAQAQLVGWLEGLFHGIQTAIVAQQMAAQAQLQQMRRALPQGHTGAPSPPQSGKDADGHPTGQYL